MSDKIKNDDERAYCKDCGYILEGLIDSSVCPECGKPIVEVLIRNSFPGQKGSRYESPTKIFGIPLISIASGPRGPEKYGKPVGIIAIGDRPKGILAIGTFPLGIFAFGAFARGIFSFGGIAMGIISFGGLNMCLAGFGGVLICGMGFGGIVAAVDTGRSMGGLVLPLKFW